MPLPVSLEDMVACVDRELAMRGKTYPRWVKAKPPKMTQRTMDEELARMRAVRSALLRADALQRLVDDLVGADVITRASVEKTLDRHLVDADTRFPVLS